MLDNKKSGLISLIYLKYRALKRAQRIKKNKKKIPPYLLKDDFEVELNYKLWTTKGARFNAAHRNRILHKLSTYSIGFLSAYLIIINIVNIYGIGFWKYDKITDNEIGFLSTAFSVLILLYSQLEGSENYILKSDKFHNCSLDIAELYNRLRFLKTYSVVGGEKKKQINEISKEYDLILKKYDNHISIDYEKLQLTKSEYFNIGFFRKRIIYVKYYFLYCPEIALH